MAAREDHPAGLCIAYRRQQSGCGGTLSFGCAGRGAGRRHRGGAGPALFCAAPPWLHDPAGWPRPSISGAFPEAHEGGCPRASGPIRHPAMTSIDPAVSVVVPVRNEAGNIAPLVTEIAKALNGQWPFEVVYVDDGSSDATEAELQQLITQH